MPSSACSPLPRGLSNASTLAPSRTAAAKASCCSRNAFMPPTPAARWPAPQCAARCRARRSAPAAAGCGRRLAAGHHVVLADHLEPVDTGRPRLAEVAVVLGAQAEAEAVRGIHVSDACVGLREPRSPGDRLRSCPPALA